MKKFIAGAVLSASMVLGAGSAFGQAYGDAGCGLGSLIFGNQSGIVQVLAATTNGLFGNQTFGITTGTLNCGSSGGGVASAEQYIVTNREFVARDAARGGGETIESLSTIAGCADATAVGTTLQQHFEFIFPNAGVSDAAVSTSIIGILQQEESLSCTFGV